MNEDVDEEMVEVEVETTLERFRQFLILSTCRSYIPESYLKDPEVFPERDGEPGAIYVEAADKVTLKKMRDITFVNARGVLGVIYESKSGNTKLKWRQVRGRLGKVSGIASANALTNLISAKVITPEYVKKVVGIATREEDKKGAGAGRK